MAIYGNNAAFLVREALNWRRRLIWASIQAFAPLRNWPPRMDMSRDFLDFEACDILQRLHVRVEYYPWPTLGDAY